MSEPIGIAPKRKFTVNQFDLANAIPNCPAHCAIALAIERTYGATNVRVGSTRDGRIAFTIGNKRYVYPGIPRAAIECQYLVDAGQANRVAPFTVNLEHGFVHKVGQSPSSNPKRKRRGHWQRKASRSPRGVPYSRTLRRELEQRQLEALSTGTHVR